MAADIGQLGATKWRRNRGHNAQEWKKMASKSRTFSNREERLARSTRQHRCTSGALMYIVGISKIPIVAESVSKNSFFSIASFSLVRILELLAR